MYIILIYDILMDDDGGKVQRNIFKTCKRFLNRIQNSVFEGELSPSQYKELVIELKKYLREDKDSCIIFKNRSSKWLSKEFLTREIEIGCQFI